MWEQIKKYLARAWRFIKKLAITLFEFTKHLVNTFKRLYKESKYNPENNEVAIALKDVGNTIQNNLDSNNYSQIDLGLTPPIVTLVYDKNTQKIKDGTVQITTAKQFDKETNKAFGSQDMLVLR
ncbi:hypothetical protein GKZ89_19345 [Bacillus mangrovi]|uniref:Uncharacterized protein n=1 Tax=Metabacillus mangrovi TaxID=1491830 RepID=A0A7X2S969_9BACI|nr:hypothetical protein [Metabacillus mangrovi]MTH55553.1 hypothetical protein [Metabacillus mangrovi]